MSAHPAFDHRDAHRFRIGLAPIGEDHWFEALGNDGDPAVRKAVTFAANPDLCWGEMPGSRPGQAEVLELMQAHLGLSPVTDIEVPPLRRAAALVDDDLCLMEPGKDGWTLTAASLCAPSFFSALDAVGKPLSGLHGPVPGFNDTLLPRVSRIFDALAEGTLLERRNWSVVASGELFLPSSAPVRALQPTIPPEAAADRLFVRMERQSLRRLPATGGLLFTIRIWRYPLSDLVNRPGEVEAFRKAWDGVMGVAGHDFRTYKGLTDLDPLVRHALATI
jgi:hypothetical protein